MSSDDGTRGRRKRKAEERRANWTRIAWRAGCCLALFCCGVYLGLTTLRGRQPVGSIPAPDSDDAVTAITAAPGLEETETTPQDLVNPPLHDVEVTGVTTEPDDAATAFVVSVSFHDLVWPCQGRISEEPGWFYVEDLKEWHYMSGVRIEGEWGRKVAAALDGTVAFQEADPVWGNTIAVDHGSGLLTTYSGLDSIACLVGDAVAQGEQLGSLAGTDLIFSTFANDEAHNPKDYLTRTR